MESFQNSRTFGQVGVMQTYIIANAMVPDTPSHLFSISAFSLKLTMGALDSNPVLSIIFPRFHDLFDREKCIIAFIMSNQNNL